MSGMAITWPQGVTPQYYTFNTTATTGTLISTGNIGGYSIRSSGADANTDQDDNRKADMEETIAELEEQIEETEAKLLDARMLLARIMRGDQPSAGELEAHLAAVAGEFE